MGAKRGQRNRDQDRYWHERRKATQAGMVGAVDVDLCCFCGGIVVSDEIGLSRSLRDVFCRACGHERGLIEELRVKDAKGKAAIVSVDAIGGFEATSGGGPGSRATGKLVGYSFSTTYEHNARSHAASESRQRNLILERAKLWLGRDKTIDKGSVATEAMSVIGMPVDDARLAVRTLRWEVYRQAHAPQDWTKLRKLTDAQVLDMRVQYAAGGATFKGLAAAFGVSGATVNFIVSGSTYKHVGGPLHRPRNTPRRFHAELSEMLRAG